jgi:hypothetical protein
MSESCVVAVQLAGSLLKAFDVRVTDAGDVYGNYSMRGIPDAHWSYHASGQQHLKKGCNYAEWEPDSTGKLVPRISRQEEPMQIVTRRACVDPIGWKAAELATALYALSESADMVVDCRHLSGNALLVFKISVVGDWTRERKIRPGFTKIKTHRFGSRVRIEIEAFEISPTSPTVVSIEPL